MTYQAGLCDDCLVTSPGQCQHTTGGTNLETKYGVRMINIYKRSDECLIYAAKLDTAKGSLTRDLST